MVGVIQCPVYSREEDEIRGRRVVYYKRGRSASNRRVAYRREEEDRVEVERVV